MTRSDAEAYEILGLFSTAFFISALVCGIVGWTTDDRVVWIPYGIFMALGAVCWLIEWIVKPR